MKITPGNQTLILAGERNAPGASSGALSIPSTAGALVQRVTIFAAQTNSTVVYFRAEYAAAAGGGSPVDAVPRTAVAPSALLSRPRAAVPGRDGYTDSLAVRRDRGITSSLPPVEQYAQIQRLGGVAPTMQRIDVLA